MVNKERKERYIGIRQENTIFSSSYLKLMFSKVSPYEDMYGKDCADFSYYEIKQMYIMLSEISTGILATLNSQMLQYTSWCLGEGLVQDKQNHYTEFHSKDYADLINTYAAKEFILSREHVLKLCDGLINPRDQFILLGMFEGLRGTAYSDIAYARMENIQEKEGGGHQIVLCSGRVADMSDKLYEYAKYADITSVYVNEKTGRESKLNVDDPTIIKNFCNTYSNSASRTAMNVNIAFNRLKRILQIDNINATQIVDSGRIDYIQRYCKKHDISIDDYIDHGDYTSLENQFGVKFNKYSFRQKYGKFLFGDNNEKKE